MQATVSEIHAHPLRPEGFEEPLFHTAASRKRILEHFGESGWLFRASEAPRPVWRRTEDAAKEMVRVIASWREVDRWWEEGGGVDLIWHRIETRSGRQEVRAEPISQVASAA